MTLIEQFTAPALAASRQIELMRKIERVPILIFHRIDRNASPAITSLTPSRLQRHLEFLHHAGVETVTFHDLLERPGLPERPVMLTFDDGYDSVFHAAAPLLERYGFRGVVFPVAGFLGRPNTWDFHWGARRVFHMNEDQLAQLSRAGWEVGVHGFSHRALTRIPFREAMSEIAESLQIVGEIAAKPPVSIAYPFGMHNMTLQQMARNSGLRFGVRSIRGPWRRESLLCLPRIPVYRFDTVRALRRKLRESRPPAAERLRLALLGAPAGLMPFYQRLARFCDRAGFSA